MTQRDSSRGHAQRCAGVHLPKRSPLLFVLASIACGAPRPFGLPYAPAPDVVLSAPPIGGNAPVDRLSALPALARVVLPDSVRELRVSTGHGMVLGAEFPLLRVVATPSAVRGELLFYRCAQASAGDGCRWSVRVARLDPAVDWPRLLARLDALGIGTWQDTVPQKVTVTDAGELLVEERRGRAYTRFAMNAPTRRADDLARQAAIVARLVDSLALAQAAPSAARAKPITMAYVCGNSFRVRNADSVVQSVAWEVVGTQERGELLLAPRGFDAPFSETYLTTEHAGPVRLRQHGSGTWTTANRGLRPCALPAVRPGIPESLSYPADVGYTLTSPEDPRFVYYRRIFTLRFVDEASDSTVIGFFREFRAVPIAGSVVLNMYVIQVPDPGPTAAALDALLRRMNAWPGVEVVAPELMHGPKAPLDGRRHPVTP